MTTGNLALVTFVGGEVSPMTWGRSDLPVVQKGLEWQRNLYSVPQGGSRYRNGWLNTHNTKGHGLGRLLKFEFNNEDTYLLCAYDKLMRVIRDEGPVTLAPVDITGISQDNPCEVTAPGHGLTTGDEVFISDVVGMVDVNKQFYIVTVLDTDTFTLQDTLGIDIDSTTFLGYVSGGTVAKIFEVPLPFALADLEDLHYTQNADTLLTARHGYPPFYLTRLDHDKWYVTTGQLSSPVSITAISKANPGVFTTEDEHGLAVNDNIYLTEIGGMTSFNDGHWIVNTVPSTTTFTVKNTNAAPVDTTSFPTFTSGGYVMRLTHRKDDPFGQKILKGITLAGPAVFTTTADHGLKINTEVYLHGISGTTELNDTKYFINTVPSTTTFTLKDSAGTVLNTSAGFTAWRTGGTVTPIARCPATLAIIQEARLGYANTPSEPDLFIFSRSPDSSTGEQRFYDFELNADDTYAVKGNLAAIFGTLEAIRWMGTTSDELVVGTTGSVRRLVGKEGNGFLTPASARAPAVNNVGSSKRQPISNGRSLYYVEDNTRSVRSFIFDFVSDGYATIDQNLVTDNLTEPGLIQVAEMRGRPDIIWALRRDGVLAGMTFKESENIFAWHRHEVSGKSRDESNRLQPWGKIISIAVLPRQDNYPRLWAIIERETTIGEETYTTRYIEYLSDKVNYQVSHNFFTGTGHDQMVADLKRWLNSRNEAVKDDLYLDSAVKYDGRLVGENRTLTPSATTGDEVHFTASSGFFDTSMIGRQLQKTYSTWGAGGGIAEIVSITSSTVAVCKVLDAFDTTEEIPAGQWIITTDEIRGLGIFNGQTVRIQEDGADGGTKTISNGLLKLSRQAGIIHVGLSYSGLWITTNMDVAGIRGSAQAKVRRVLESTVRYYATAGFKIGTTPWNAEDVVFRENDDLTGVPSPLRDGVEKCVLSDIHDFETKQICIVKDDPTPLTILSVDSEVEVINA